MSKKTKKTNGTAKADSNLAKQAAPASVPIKGGQLIATARNDITIENYSDILKPQDPTLEAKGEKKGLKLYDEVLQDARARTALSKRISKVTRREWQVEPASDEAIDITASEGVEVILKALPFDAICKSLLKAILKGFSVAEIVWFRNTDGLIAPLKIKDQNPMRFTFDADWRIRLLTLDNREEGEELPERKFIVHRFDANANNPFGHGLGSVLFWHVLFKREGVAFWMKFMDKFASPIPFGKYAHGTSKEEQDKLLGVLRQMVSQGALVAPIGTEVDFLEATRSGEAGYEAWCRYWDEQTAEVVLGSTLATGVKGQGSRAASQTHADETDGIVDDDSDQICETLNSTLITWISELNWPAATPPKVWRPRPRNQSDEADVERKVRWVQQSALRILEATRLQGYEPKDVDQWLGNVLGTEVIKYKLPFTPEGAATKSGGKQDSTEFATSEPGPVDHLVSQLEQLAGPKVHSWIDEIKEKLGAAEDYADASQALLDVYPGLEVDPLGNLLSDAVMLAELQGRSDIIDETGFSPTGSKKN
ncbi:DUF935 family protein [Pseudovibrio sp. Tun.PSC04-5.I4]|uniref:DUF935 domain-containing protein n=1 Tax=Pseudovibrio sp. Tun.PSC04-5.I4 TaxID=1798213 RepID=UPI00087E1195|nr:DUF935 family protein [Pseudovibrio sp. Tun.PSC04-5.I4]SDQ17701.1 Mu-like prophage protein gp29 [Pseudovibrio sp. Tun.PSC04-5.I4]